VLKIAPAPESYFISGELSGTWFDPDLNGTGLALEFGTRPDGQPVVVVAWYTYDDGMPLWLVGSQAIEPLQSLTTMTLYRGAGADFGVGFDPDDVSLEAWGELDLSFTGPREGLASYRRQVDDLTGTLDLVKLSGDLRPLMTGGESLNLNGVLSGTWQPVDGSGQGLTLEFSENSNGPVSIATWFAYRDGQPFWLVGSANMSADDRSVSIPMLSFSGTGFGPDFDPNEIQSQNWGELELEFSDCDHARLSYDFGESALGGLGSGELDLERSTSGLFGVRCYE